MNQEYYILIKKLKGFVSKYYTNLIIKGLILSVTIILTMFLLANTFEYFAWNNILIRTILFYVISSLTLLIVIFYVAIPLFKLGKIGKTLNFQEAAKIIGDHFPKISDKLLNTIQLKSIYEASESSKSVELLSASIDQRASELSPLPFKNAINFKQNLKYLKFIVAPVLVIVFILILFPAFIIEPSNRIVNYKERYTKPLPYTLHIENEKLEALQKDDFTLIVRSDGAAIPAEIYINDGNYKYAMAGPAKGKFSYTFKSLSNDIYFTINTDDYTSESFHLIVLPKPTIYSFDVLLNYPHYLNRKRDIIENSGDLIVPEGTDIKWLIYTKDTRKIIFKREEEKIHLAVGDNNIFQHSIKAESNFWYSLFAENEHVKIQDSLSFSVQVIKDEYPSIEVSPLQDETQYGIIFFNGSISDDHGFHSLKFYYRKDSVIEVPWRSIDLSIDKRLTTQAFSYAFQSYNLNLMPGEGITYYFEVRDNDEINGFKRVKTSTYQFHLDGIDEIEDKYENISDKIKEKIENALKELEKLNRELEEKREDLFEKKEISWTDKKQLSELLEKQEVIQSQINELKKLNEELSNYEDLLNKENSELLEDKIDELNKMFDQLLTEDLEKMKEDLEKIDKEKISELLQNLEKKNDELKTDLEKNLEIYKQLELEKKIQESIDKLNKLAEDQKELADKTADNGLEEEQALSKQKEIEERFSEIEKELEAADELNSTMEQPFDLNTGHEIRDTINNELNEANSKLSKGKQKKASQNQKQAGEKMEKMANDLGMMMQSAMMSRMGEDAEKIKKILDNLLDLSFNQESLMEIINETTLNDPKYVENLAELQIIKDGYLILHDSLIAISKRQMAVQQFIVRESDKINLHINRALLYLQDRRRGQALNDQQYSMTSMNNLALMLSESLDQMQAGMKMSGKNPGQSCPNPGEGSPGSLDEILKMQQGMNQGMEKGEGKNGLEGEKGLNQQTEALARMAALQSEIRKKLGEYLKELEGSEGSSGDLSKLLDEMRKTEEDIVNRKITKETLERQKHIEVRLLKSEKAKLEREKKEKRESVEGINRKRIGSETDLKLQNKKTNKEDFLQTIPIELTPYYNDLLKKYLYKLETDNGS